jgi:hypothetical protein
MKRAPSVVEVLVVVSTMIVAMTVAPSINAAADSRIRVLEETPLSPAADVPADVRKDCDDLGDELPRALARASRSVTLVKSPHDLTGRYLSIEITHVRAGRAGAFSGPKFMTVRGALIENGKEIADFDAKRGAISVANTCSMLDKAEKELGSDIARWLENPRPRSHLGDK